MSRGKVFFSEKNITKLCVNLAHICELTIFKPEMLELSLSPIFVSLPFQLRSLLRPWRY